MTTTTIAAINSALTDILAAATGLTYHQDYDELTEAIVDYPVLQVYPEDGQQDPTGNTDRTTFGAVVRQTVFTFNADLYAKQRQHIGEDMAALIPLIDAIIAELEKQKTKPYFGLHDSGGGDAIKAFSWSFRRVVFQYGDPQQSFVGARFTITIRTF